MASPGSDRVQSDGRRCLEGLGRKLLQQQVRRAPEVRAAGRKRLREQPQESRACDERSPSRALVRFPLPLQPEPLARRTRRSFAAPRAFAAIVEDGLRYTRTGSPTLVAIRIGADHRPVVAPDHRLKMHDASVRAAILKMHEPRLAGAAFRSSRPGAVRSPVCGLASARSALRTVRALTSIAARSASRSSRRRPARRCSSSRSACRTWDLRLSVVTSCRRTP